MLLINNIKRDLSPKKRSCTLRSSASIISVLFLLLSTPGNLSTISWFSVGPGGGGWLSAITIVDDPQDSVYVGCDVGGIYKSIDHGQTWEIKNSGLSTYYVQDIAYDPSAPSTLYAATRGGVFKSTNGGERWESKRSNFPAENDYHFSAPVSDIVVDPHTPGIVYAAIGVTRAGYAPDTFYWQSVETKGAIYKSIHGGEDWTLIRGTGIDPAAMIYSLAINPIDTFILYAATDHGVYKSTDSGTTWSSINTNLPSHLQALIVVVNPKTPDTLYVTMWAEPGSANWRGGVYKSIDGGNIWQAKNSGLPVPGAVGDEYGFTSNYPVLVINPDTPDILYLGNTPWTPDPGIYKTIDGGENWNLVTRPPEPEELYPNVNMGWVTEHGISVKCLAISPRQPDQLYFGTSTNLFKTEDAGDSWNQAYSEQTATGLWKGNGLETTCVGDIAVDPTNSTIIYAGYWDMGLLKSTDGGNSFQRLVNGMVKGGVYDYSANTFSIIVDPAHHNHLYVAAGWWEENKGTVCTSSDQGANWNCEPVGLPRATVWSIALDTNSPANERILYAASYEHGVYKSANGGRNWAAVNSGLGVDGNLRVRKVLVDPTNSQILYAGIEAEHIEGRKGDSTIQGGLFKSTDAGISWSRIDTILLSQASVWDIAVVPGNPQIVYAATSSEYDHTMKKTFPGGVYKSVDGGTSWSKMNNGFGEESNLDVSAIAISPVNSNILYAATSDAPYHDRSSGRGIFKSIDAGATWVAVSDQSNVLSFSAITIDPQNPYLLYAGSSGNGVIKGVDHMENMSAKDPN
jgi:photosystem II stability/assembly factor-like uncharacterized protein